ncbi:GNAT family N-acetyltransferase [Nocardia sp. BMG51109]|uniref:GNAT family N-acetyltransferase n=1 Tax=Nocardia sp. BMG51109 TaxID=1056816 RepID=UPI000462FE9E|nr:GNAT family N-acetyltransferase [Nocardia sp. BMG51109]
MTEQVVTTAVVRNAAQHRYEVWYGDKLAGFTEFREPGDETVFIDTEIDGEFGGRGLGSALIRDAVADAAARGRTLVPRCPFVKNWLDKHPEYDAHVAGKSAG